MCVLVHLDLKTSQCRHFGLRTFRCFITVLSTFGLSVPMWTQLSLRTLRSYVNRLLYFDLGQFAKGHFDLWTCCTNVISTIEIFIKVASTSDFSFLVTSTFWLFDWMLFGTCSFSVLYLFDLNLVVFMSFWPFDFLSYVISATVV